MLERTHIPEARWWIVEGDDKKKARLNCIDHLLTQVPYSGIDHPAVKLPERVRHKEYSAQTGPQGTVHSGEVLIVRGAAGWCVVCRM